MQGGEQYRIKGTHKNVLILQFDGWVSKVYLILSYLILILSNLQWKSSQVFMRTPGNYETPRCLWQILTHPGYLWQPHLIFIIAPDIDPSWTFMKAPDIYDTPRYWPILDIYENPPDIDPPWIFMISQILTHPGYLLHPHIFMIPPHIDPPWMFMKAPDIYDTPRYWPTLVIYDSPSYLWYPQ